MKIFLTGATGVIGRRVVPLLLGRRHDVTACVRSPEAAQKALALGARACVMSLFDADGLRRAVAGHDAVVNLATHIPASSLLMFMRRAWRENDRLRRIGSANLVDAALAGGVQRFVQESFAPVYPDRGDKWIEEDTPLQPVPFNRSLEESERSALRFAATGNGGVVLRFGAFYGADATQTVDLIKAVQRAAGRRCRARRGRFFRRWRTTTRLLRSSPRSMRPPGSTTSSTMSRSPIASSWTRSQKRST